MGNQNDYYHINQKVAKVGGDVKKQDPLGTVPVGRHSCCRRCGSSSPKR